MRKDRRKIDVREEYYVRSSPALALPPPQALACRADAPLFLATQRMRATGDIGESDDYENVRVGRLPGQAEWGELPVAKKD